MKALRTLAAVVFSIVALTMEAGVLSFADSWSTYLGGENDVGGDQSDSARAVLLTKSTVLVGGALDCGLLETDELWYDEGWGEWRHSHIEPIGEGISEAAGYLARIPIATPLNASYAQIGISGDDSPIVVHALATNANSVVGVGERSGRGAVLKGNAAFSEAALLEGTPQETLPLVAVAMGVKSSSKISGDEIYALGMNTESAILYRMAADGAILKQLACGSGVATRAKMAFSSDGTKLYLAFGTKLLVVTDFTNMKNIQQQVDLASGVAGLAVLSNGVVVATQAGRLIRYEDETGTLVQKEERTIEGAFGEIAALAADAAGRLAVAGTATSAWFKSTDGTAFVGPQAGWVEIFEADGSSVFRAWIGKGHTALTDVSLSAEALAVSGTTFDAGLAEGGFLTTKIMKGPEDSFGYLKVWRGANFMPDPDGAVKVDLEPKHARWSLDGGAHWLRSGTLTNLPPEKAYTITFSALAGYFPQEPIAGVSVSGVTNEYAIVYEKIPEPPVRRVINAHWVHFEFNLPAGVAYAGVTETLQAGASPTVGGEAQWSPRKHTISDIYSDILDSTRYKLDPASNDPGTYTVSGIAQFYDEEFEEIGEPFPVEGDSVIVVHGAEWRPGTLITVQ